MITTSTVKQALKVDIAISAPMAEALSLWSQMYENKAPWLSEDVKSLNLPAAVAGEIARSATIEMNVNITGSARADYLAAQVGKVLDQMRIRIEQGASKGGLMMKPFVNGKNIDVDYVQADMFYPVSFDSSGKITACIFADQRTVGSDYYTRLEYHHMVKDGCEIVNQAYKSSTRDTLGHQVPLTGIEDWAGLEPIATITAIDRPMFAYFKYPLANTIDTTSPLGVSCYSRAVDLIEDADNLWSNLMWEFESGKRAIYVDSLAFGKDADGKSKLPNKRLYRSIDAPGSDIGDGNKLFEQWTPEFREASIISGLDSILKRIEYNCGLARGSISDPTVEAKTATEITATKQRTYATIVDTQKSIEDTIIQLIWAMDIYATLYKLAPRGTYSTAFDFDDSVVVDKDAQFQQDLRLVGQSIMGPVEFRMRNFGEDEATAKQKIAEAREGLQTEASLFNQGA